LSVDRYSDQFMGWLKEFGYTHCFYVSGGNVMHMLEAASHVFTCIPFMHEVGAGIATDYFNESHRDGQKAFLLVTAGPGLTNAITSIVGAWTESREMLIIGGQAKSSEVSRGKYRQIGFQEIDGETLCSSITKYSKRIEERISKAELLHAVKETWSNRKGPVFLEICLDVSTDSAISNSELDYKLIPSITPVPSSEDIAFIIKEIRSSMRPIILLGGGISRKTSLDGLVELEIPIATTFNGADRIGFDYKFFAGRPNWYGSRWANLLIQQSDLVIAFGTRLGIQQVGYNWKEFAPNAKVIQIDIDELELAKGFPRLHKAVHAEANVTLMEVVRLMKGEKLEISEWQDFIQLVRGDLAHPEAINVAQEPYLEAMAFVHSISSMASSDDILLPCSSGAAGYEGAMRVLINQTGQIIVTSHALASMGYGLSGAIGASIANPLSRTILFEGDGGFAQNLQELGTVKANQLNLKIFIMDNQGYQSIRGNQKSTFNSHYVGCDRDTGLYLPDWNSISNSFGLEVMELTSTTFPSGRFTELFEGTGPVVFVVKIDPDQTYWPRILSQKNRDGSIESNPLHKMEPPMTQDQESRYLPYLKH
jgi:acetolactate synthase I/II/III large subunit